MIDVDDLLSLVRNYNPKCNFLKKNILMIVKKCNKN